MITITLLAENQARGEGILGEHGLAYWIDVEGRRVLFDTGQGMALLNNARRLRVNLAEAEAIVLSHGHYDHVGGLEAALREAPRASLYLHPRAVEKKYSGALGRARCISTRFVEQELFREGGRQVVATASPVEVVPGLWATGEIPRETDFEDTGGPFYLDEALTLPDPLFDDQSLFMPTKEGVVVIFGCAHSGSINTLRHIAKLTGDSRIRLMLGGLHLENASARRMDETMKALKACKPERMGFCHCTGFHAIRRLWNDFPQACIQTHAGMRVELP